MSGLRATLTVAAVAFFACSAALAGGSRAGFNGLITDDEPNNNTAAGAMTIPMTGFSTRFGILSLTHDDIDVVKVFMFAGDALTVVTTPLSGPATAPFSSPNTLIEVADAGGALLTRDDNGGSDFPSDRLTHGSVARYRATADGPVSVQVSGAAGLQSGQYILMISLTGASDPDIAEPEPSETPAQALVLGLPASGPISGVLNISSAADVDFMAVDMSQGDVLTATTTPLNGPDFVTPDTVIVMFDSDGATPLVSNDDDDNIAGDPGVALGSTIRFMAPHTGRYFLRVESFAGESQGLYEISMCVAPRPRGSCPADLNGDGAVNSSDLAQLLGAWGVCQ